MFDWGTKLIKHLSKSKPHRKAKNEHLPEKKQKKNNQNEREK